LDAVKRAPPEAVTKSRLTREKGLPPAKVIRCGLPSLAKMKAPTVPLFGLRTGWKWSGGVRAARVMPFSV
jgi:hypothetical protein